MSMSDGIAPRATDHERVWAWTRFICTDGRPDGYCTGRAGCVYSVSAGDGDAELTFRACRMEGHRLVSLGAFAGLDAAFGACADHANEDVCRHRVEGTILGGIPGAVHASGRGGGRRAFAKTLG